MLLQTNSYIVPKEKRAAHNHLMARFRQVLQKIGCDHFEVYEQVGANWNGIDAGGRFVQLMKFRDRKHCQAVQVVERQDPAAQALVKEFCDLINFPYQEQQGLFAHGYYQAVIDPIRTKPGELAFHNFESDDVKADTARRIAAGLPDAPHSIDDAPNVELDAVELDAVEFDAADLDSVDPNSVLPADIAGHDADDLAENGKADFTGEFSDSFDDDAAEDKAEHHPKQSPEPGA